MYEIIVIFLFQNNMSNIFKFLQIFICSKRMNPLQIILKIGEEGESRREREAARVKLLDYKTQD